MPSVRYTIRHAERFPSVVKLRMEGVPGEVRYAREGTCSIKNTTDICNRDIYSTAKCSKCRANYAIDFRYLKFCPNCGAKVIE